MTSTSTITMTAHKRSLPVSPVGAGMPAAPHVVDGKVTTHIKIDDYWYDLTNWKGCHPGGQLILEQMDGNDATDAFYSLHSEEACVRLTRLQRSKSLPAHMKGPPPPTKAALAFRVFRKQLEDEGYFKRNHLWDLFYTLSVYVLGGLGTYFALNDRPWLAVLLLGVGMQQAGWIGHDFIHARGSFLYWNALALQWINGFSRSWWSNKHNTHHVFTNYIGVDADIENDPVFHLFFPDPKDDTIFRKMQHWYFVPVASVLYFSWRIQSLQHSFRTLDPKELVFQLINYVWLYFLGWKVAFFSIYFGGFLVSFIVTATHQSEEMIEKAPGEDYSFCEGQFLTTRNATTSDPVTEWLWGGMQYQLEHHLFPTMPKYYYARVAPRVREWAKANGIEYRCDDQVDILIRNFHTLQYFSRAGPQSQKNK